MDVSKQSIIMKYALDCGEFACTAVWIRGLFSNFLRMYPKVKKYLSHRYIYKNYKLYNFYMTWYLTRHTWPRSIFISTLKNYTIICKEALSLFIPIIGIVDTNIKHHYFNLPIPSNDDSYESLIYICSIVSKFILVQKYKKLLLWGSTARYTKSSQRVLSMSKLFQDLSNNLLNYNLVKKDFITYFNKVKYYSLMKFTINKLINRKRKVNNIQSDFFDLLNLKKFNFYLNILNIGWYKKYSIYKNRWQLIKPYNKYYLVHLFKRKYPLKYLYTRWFFKLYYYTYLHYFRNFIDTVVSHNFFKLLSIKKLSFITLFFKYVKIKEKWWFKNANKKLYLRTYWWQSPISRWENINKFIKGFNWKFGNYFFQFYLVLFIKFLNFNMFNIKLQNYY